MTVSIIVPIFNEYDVLKVKISSLKQLESAGADLLFVDGGSNDGTCEFLESCGCRCFQAPLGRASQMNAGAERAKGSTLVFLHVDTDMPVAMLKRLAVQHVSWGFATLELANTRFIYRIIERGVRFRSFLFNTATGDQVIFFEKTFFQKINGYPALALMEDTQLTRRAKRIIPPTVLKFRVLSSARRWETFGPVRTVVFMWYIQLLFRCGIDTERLNSMYVSGLWRIPNDD